jgi:hypothetical protein
VALSLGVAIGQAAVFMHAVHALPFADVRNFDDPYAVPTAPRPPTLPELTHAENEGTLELTAGAILPNTGGGAFTHAYVQRLSLEMPLAHRRWYVGADYEAAESSTAQSRAVSGNVEIQGRTLWATPTGLAFGGGTALVLPAASFDASSPAADAALRAATLRPWDVSFFVPDAFGVRPFVDLRAIDGAFVAQFRQGLDFLFSTSALDNWRVYATTGLYLGFWLTHAVAAGLEAFEAYAIDVPGVSDGARASVLVSPNVRLALPWVEPVISMFTSIGTPLQGASSHVWGFTIGATVALPAVDSLASRMR